MIVDAHTHVVSGDESRYPLDLAQPDARPDEPAGWPMMATEAGSRALASHMDLAGVDRAVLVQGWAAYQYDNRYVVDAAAADGRRFVAVCAVDPADPDVGTKARALASAPAVGGLRIMAGFADTDTALSGPGARAVWAVAAEHSLPVVVFVYPHQIAALVEVATASPETVVVVDHCGFVDVAAGLGDLEALARLDQVVFIASTLVLRQGPGPAETLRRLVDLAGADRLMWGSVHPAIAGWTYSSLADLARAATTDLSSREATDFLGGTALRCWPVSD